jgi:hypothetical protein
MTHIDRLAELKHWLGQIVGSRDFTVQPASEDASFRRYFRVKVGDESYIVMDAPPTLEDCRDFVKIAKLLESHGLHVPHIFNADLTQGFLLLSDLGDTLYLSRLNRNSVDTLYGDALDALLSIQTCTPHTELPPYDATLLDREMALFRDWFLLTHLQLTLDTDAESIITETFTQLRASALVQPQVFVHRDYHSRNLMVTDINNPGILDFQDAVSGPISYDLVSLLRDCYIAWPDSQIDRWVTDYHARLLTHKLIDADYPLFKKWFDWMGMQRHLKAIGIFSRLKHRDGKNGYLKDIPRTLDYVLAVCTHYPELGAFGELLHRLRIRESLST